ncbi:MAG: SRPBCC family protein [Arcicella sp.]|nr:SRPBCC family protein [Arcicella sp.]
MNSPKYHFITHWLVDATASEVYEILKQNQRLPEWWSAVYLDVKILKDGDSDGIGKLVELYTKGWLPYTLRWKYRVLDVQKPHRIQIEAIGDFIGNGLWTLENTESGQCKMTYDWQIEAKKPLLKKLSWLMKPLFSFNHLWAMQKGEESLKLEILRQKGILNVPSPPKPTFPHNLLNNKIL